MKTPDKVSKLELECTCVEIGVWKWDKLMKGATKANHNQINKLVKKHIPKLYEGLGLNFYNPYDYYKTKNYLVLIHSNIEYFLKYKL